MSYIADAKNIVKNYGNTVALKGVDFFARTGEVTGIIGPDGAGKSTLMKILLTLEDADSGEVKVFGRSTVKDYKYIRRHIGYMPEIFSLYSDLSVEENLKFYYRIYKIKEDFESKVEKLYRFNRLKNFAATRAGSLSGGMKQKLALSCALMHEPELLILDEPTTGVDPLSRREFWKMLNELKNSGIVVIVSTPYMDEALQCDNVFLMHEGEVLSSGAPQTLINDFGGKIYKIETENPHKYYEDVRNALPDAEVFLAGKSIRFTLSDHLTPEQEGSIKSIFKQEVKIVRAEKDLEDLFLTLILRRKSSE